MALLSFVIFLFLIYTITLYNKFIKHKNLVKEGWSGIDVQLKLRHDLVPNLCAVVQGYVAHEKEVLEDIVKQRSQCTQQQKLEGVELSENQLSKSLKTLFALAENYPELKANQNFLELSKQLVKIEDTLQMARRYYNGAVRDYNVLVSVFPNNIFAAMFGFSEAKFFELESVNEAQNIKVKF